MEYKASCYCALTNVKLVSENNQQYYVDAVSGDLETVEIE